jgi:hypothetical protein
MKTHLKKLSAAIAAHGEAVKALETHRNTLAEKSDRLEVLQADGKDSDVDEIITLTALVPLLPGRIENAERQVAQAKAATVRIAADSLEALTPFMNQREQAFKDAALAAVAPFVADRWEAMATVERFSALQTANRLPFELNHALEGGSPGDAINQIHDLLVKAAKQAPAAKETSPV